MKFFEGLKGLGNFDKSGKKDTNKNSDNKSETPKNSNIQDSALKYQGYDDKDQVISKLKQQKSLKPRIINDEFDKSYIRANSVTILDEDEEKEKIKTFICPINKKIMEDPVITPYGTTYERNAILKWIQEKKTDYINNSKELTEDMLVTNYILKIAIKDYNESLKY